VATRARGRDDDLRVAEERRRVVRRPGATVLAAVRQRCLWRCHDEKHQQRSQTDDACHAPHSKHRAKKQGGPQAASCLPMCRL
jgi:hypothetical protein